LSLVVQGVRADVGCQAFLGLRLLDPVGTTSSAASSIWRWRRIVTAFSPVAAV